MDKYVWSECGKAPQNVLNEFWSKINSVNSRLRKRRKFKQTEVAFFEVDDLLAYKSSSGMYRVLVCAKVDLYRGKHEYTFVPTSYYGETIPTLEEIRNYGIYGVRIAVTGDRESVSQSQNGVSELWDLFSEETFLIPKNSPFIIGLFQNLVVHKNLMQFKDKLIRFGTLKIKTPFNKQGSGSFSKNFVEFDKSEQFYLALKYKVFPIRILCEP